MPKRARKSAPPRTSAEPGAAKGVLSYLAEHPWYVLIACLAVGSLRIADTYSIFNHTIDEPAHIACGIEWLDQHAYKLEPHHPPFARVMDALGPYLAGAHFPAPPEAYQGGPFRQGALILYGGGQYQRDLTLARIGVLPSFWIAGLAVFWWSKRYFGGLVAAFTAILFTFLPPILAHAGVATNDMALTAFTGASIAAMLAWLDRPSAGRSALFGAAVALAVLSKFTAAVFIPVCYGAALVWFLVVRRPSPAEVILHAKRLAIPFSMAVATGAVVIWACYRFSFGLCPELGFRVPAPELFSGFMGVLRLNKGGYPAYLLGQHSMSGWWYYYLVVLGVKTPLAFLALTAIGAVVAFRRRRDAGGAYALPLAISGALVFLSFFSRINTGVRYLLPVYFGFAILAAIGVSELIRPNARRKWTPAAAYVLLAWFALSSLFSHPDYLAYFNELVGSEPEKVLADSDLDWGQDMNRAGKRLRELGAQEVAFAPFILADLRQHGWPPVTGSDPQFPSEGWNVVSTTVWKVARMGLNNKQPNVKLWPDTAKPRERVGKGILLYYFPPAANR